MRAPSATAHIRIFFHGYCTLFHFLFYCLNHSQEFQSFISPLRPDSTGEISLDVLEIHSGSRRGFASEIKLTAFEFPFCLNNPYFFDQSLRILHMDAIWVRD